MPTVNEKSRCFGAGTNWICAASDRRKKFSAKNWRPAGLELSSPWRRVAGSQPRQFSSPHHFLGTTRMHQNPRNGVVDADCRVHDVPNLFIAGSSVFPTGGFANPTLTSRLPWRLRLANHLPVRTSARA